MNAYTRQEISVGVFVALGVAALAYLSINLGGLHLGRSNSTTLSARFASVGDLKQGDVVKIAGVAVGVVDHIELVKFEAETHLRLTAPVKLPVDTIASVRSAGLLGDAYISLSPGAADEDLADGGRITRTEAAISVTDLLAKYAFGSPTESAKPSGTPGEDDDPLSWIGSAPTPAPATSSATESAVAPATTGSAAPQLKPKPVFKDPLE